MTTAEIVIPTLTFTNQLHADQLTDTDHLYKCQNMY
jgi:hypothetical protein